MKKIVLLTCLMTLSCASFTRPRAGNRALETSLRYFEFQLKKLASLQPNWTYGILLFLQRLQQASDAFTQANLLHEELQLRKEFLTATLPTLKNFKFRQSYIVSFNTWDAIKIATNNASSPHHFQKIVSTLYNLGRTVEQETSYSSEKNYSN